MRIIFGWIVILSLWACPSVQGQKIEESISRLKFFWHNLNAKYNSLIFAREELAIAKKMLYSQHQENYAELQPILILPDSTQNKVSLDLLNDAEKKAIFITQNHYESKFIDNAYAILGEISILKNNPTRAIDLFKLANGSSDESESEQLALVGMMQAYIMKENYATASRVDNILKSMNLSKEIYARYKLNKAYLYQQQSDYQASIKEAEEALKILPKSKQKARLHFIVAQMYELNDEQKEALEHYKKVNKNSPSYELKFYTKINSLLSISDDNSQRELEKMLTDIKNNDLKDKIYSALAYNSIRRGSEKEGINFLKKAVSTAGTKEAAAKSHLKLARLFYQVENFEMAKLYYDSTLFFLTPENSSYQEVSSKQKTLNNYSEFVKALQLEDSLQKIARYSPEDLKFSLKKAYEAQRKEISSQKSHKQETPESLLQKREKSTPKVSSGSSWYFYDLSKYEQGRAFFIQKWGVRPLEDQWRRKRKNSYSTNEIEALSNLNTEVNSSKDENIKSTEFIFGGEESFAEQTVQLLPNTPEKIKESNKRIEQAYFSLGKVIANEMNNLNLATDTFENLFKKFPNSSYEPEAYYILYSLYKDTPKEKLWKDKLTTKFPKSNYSLLTQRKIALNKTDSRETEAATGYKSVYSLYLSGNYTQAYEQSNAWMASYMGTKSEELFFLIQTLSLGKLKKFTEYKQHLKDYIKLYSKSERISYINTLLEVAEMNK